MALTRQPSRNVLVLQNSGAEVSTAQNISPYYQWVLNGEMTFPQVESQDALQQVDAAFLIHQVRISAKVAGTSTYNIRILSHDVTGGAEVILVDEAVIFSVDKGIHLLPLQTAQVPENCTLELTIFEQTVGTPAKDISASLIGQPFTGLTPLQNGHKIQDNADITYNQRENLKFDNHFGVADDLVNDQTDVTFTESSLNSYVDGRINDILDAGGAKPEVINMISTVGQGSVGNTWGKKTFQESRGSITGSTIDLINDEVILPAGDYKVDFFIAFENPSYSTNKVSGRVRNTTSSQIVGGGKGGDAAGGSNNSDSISGTGILTAGAGEKFILEYHSVGGGLGTPTVAPSGWSASMTITKIKD